MFQAVFQVGDRVRIKTVSELEPWGAKVISSKFIESHLVSNGGDIILLEKEMKYLGKIGTVEIISEKKTYVEGTSDFLVTDVVRPLAIRMDDGYLLRLIPYFVVEKCEADTTDTCWKALWEILRKAIQEFKGGNNN